MMFVYFTIISIIIKKFLNPEIREIKKHLAMKKEENFLLEVYGYRMMREQVSRIIIEAGNRSLWHTYRAELYSAFASDAKRSDADTGKNLGHWLLLLLELPLLATHRAQEARLLGV